VVKRIVKIVTILLLRSAFAAYICPLHAEVPEVSFGEPDLTIQQHYRLMRASSADPAGTNNDFPALLPNATVTLLDVDGPGAISHILIEVGSEEPYFLKRALIRMYWDGESSPSVEAPLGDFFGLGLGQYHSFQSRLLSVGNTGALNVFFPMPFAKHARITITNEGAQQLWAVAYNIDYRKYNRKLPAGTLYFHAQYHQAQPNKGWTNTWNWDVINNAKNPSGKDNYVFLDAAGRGQYVGLTLSVIANQEYWWGEGDDMFFIDGDEKPSIAGTGTEDYFLGGWDYGGSFERGLKGIPFSYDLYGAPVVGEETAGGRSSVYRFHLDSPIPFGKSIRGTLEHGAANARSDNYYSVAYWYQLEPHKTFPSLPPVQERIPRIVAVGSPADALPGSVPER
jgi:hypothetical protein